MRPLLAVLLLSVFALGARSVGIDFGMPVWEEPDPNVPIHVGLLRRGATSPDRMHSDRQYPHLLARIAQPLGDRTDAPSTLEGHLALASHRHVQVRWVVALLSVLLVPGTWILARRFLAPPWALLAAALIATSLLLQSFGQQARPHGASGIFFLAAVLAAMRLAERPSVGSYLAGGVTAGLAVGVLHSGLAVLPALLAAHLLARRNGARLFDPRALLVLACLALSVRLLYPFLFEVSLGSEWGETRIEGGALRFADHIVTLGEFRGLGVRTVFLTLWYYEPVLTVLLGVAVAALVARRGRTEPTTRAPLLVALAFAVPYLVLIGLFEKTYERFVIPLLPFFAVFAAWGAAELVRRLPRGARRAAAVVLALALLLPAAATLRMGILRARPDTLDLAAEWIAANVEPGGEPVYLTAPLDVPLARTPESLRTKGGKRRFLYTPWTRYQARVEPGAGLAPQWEMRWLRPDLTRDAGVGVDDPAAFLDAVGPGVFLIEVFEERTEFPLWTGLRGALRAKGELQARLSPDGDGGATELPLFFQLSDHFADREPWDWPHFTARLLTAERVGPVVELWRIAP